MKAMCFAVPLTPLPLSHAGERGRILIPAPFPPEWGDKHRAGGGAGWGMGGAECVDGYSREGCLPLTPSFPRDDRWLPRPRPGFILEQGHPLAERERAVIDKVGRRRADLHLEIGQIELERLIVGKFQDDQGIMAALKLGFQHRGAGDRAVPARKVGR